MILVLAIYVGGMRTMNKEIIERSSGYWIVDDHGIVDGSFIDYEEALEVLKNLEDDSNDE